MASPTTERRQCPTRADGGDTLIAHWIELATCRRRQREHYHKCYTCVHGNGRAQAPMERRELEIPAEPGEAPPLEVSAVEAE